MTACELQTTFCTNNCICCFLNAFEPAVLRRTTWLNKTSQPALAIAVKDSLHQQWLSTQSTGNKSADRNADK
uniref:Uncharacterized protein n=1 Tax=Ascaris lumbricoides TaxID=6252 RepID=A0A9J2P0A0_ASCLU